MEKPRINAEEALYFYKLAVHIQIPYMKPIDEIKDLELPIQSMDLVLSPRSPGVSRA